MMPLGSGMATFDHSHGTSCGTPTWVHPLEWRAGQNGGGPIVVRTGSGMAADVLS
jgi:hypothetical protein